MLLLSDLKSHASLDGQITTGRLAGRTHQIWEKVPGLAALPGDPLLHPQMLPVLSGLAESEAVT